MFLDKIVASKEREVRRLKETLSVSQAERQIANLPPCKGFVRALASTRRSMGLIAEVKKASPSKGLIREDFDPQKLAQSYERAGADCVSVLTDTPFFQGSNEALRMVRDAVELPILRKDFTIDPLQIYEARLIGADAVLLIAALLTRNQMRDFLALARDLGMDALVEVHHREELETALEFNPALVGINNRDLHTFVTDIRVTENLIKHIPDGVTIVSESGISKPEDVVYLKSVGAHALLVGEHFMRQPDVEQAVLDLMEPPIAAGEQRL